VAHNTTTIGQSCEQCGSTFFPRKHHRIDNRRFCSRHCAMLARPKESVEERFWSKVTKTDRCWIWNGGVDKDGYGNFWANRKNNKAHRFSWELENGPVPDGMVVCHTCDTPSCCNPACLFLGTNLDNIHDRHQKGRTASGERAHLAKLTWEQVDMIRSSKDSNAKLGRQLGGTRQTIRSVRIGETWNHRSATPVPR
jgi:hypothetical protein